LEEAKQSIAVLGIKICSFYFLAAGATLEGVPLSFI
jgi:hypothetical protein